MAKKIIVLEKKQGNGSFEINYIYWLDVPVAQQPLRANPSATSAYKGATQVEIDALKSGEILEVPRSTVFNDGVTNTFIATALANSFVTAQNLLNSDTQYQYYGTNWDGTSWTIQGA